MTMNSLSLIPQLQELPKEAGDDRRSTRAHLEALINTDRAMYAAEQASASAAGFWSIFDTVNVDDTITMAYRSQYPNLAAEHSLHDQWVEMMERGESSMTGFISGVKGKVAEFGVADQLRESGWIGVEVATNPTQAAFDITATPPEGGAAVLWQVKTGGAEYASDVADAMADNPVVQFAVSSDIYERIAESTPDVVDRMMDIGTDWELVEGVEDGLGTLAANLGIDIPDSLAQILPYAAAIAAGARLIYSVIRTEREFSEVDRTTRNKIQVVQALTLMARMGITTVLSAAGASGGAAAGTVIPGVGNIVGGGVGALGGGLMGVYLNRHLQPRMLRLGLNICGYEEDDLFYFKNKLRVGRECAQRSNLEAPRAEGLDRRRGVRSVRSRRRAHAGSLGTQHARARGNASAADRRSGGFRQRDGGHRLQYCDR